MKKTARKAGRFLLFYNSLRVKELMKMPCTRAWFGKLTNLVPRNGADLFLYFFLTLVFFGSGSNHRIAKQGTHINGLEARKSLEVRLLIRVHLIKG